MNKNIKESMSFPEMEKKESSEPQMSSPVKTTPKV